MQVHPQYKAGQNQKSPVRSLEPKATRQKPRRYVARIAIDNNSSEDEGVVTAKNDFLGESVPVFPSSESSHVLLDNESVPTFLFVEDPHRQANNEPSGLALEEFVRVNLNAS